MDSSDKKCARILYNKPSKVVWDADSKLFNDLIDQLLLEIFLRLPAKSAARYRLVCKKWRSLINSRYFVTRFIPLRHSHQRGNMPLRIVYQYRYNCPHECDCCSRDSSRSALRIIPLDSDSGSGSSSFLRKKGDFRLSFLPCPPDNVNLEGASADLVLCCCRTRTGDSAQYYVSNLYTRQWIALPPVRFREFTSVGFQCFPQSRVDRHKFIIVRITLRRRIVPRSEFRVHIFKSRERVWRKFYLSSPVTMKRLKWMPPLVAYKGMFHWLHSDCIVVYDPLNSPERFSRVIKLPGQRPDWVPIIIASCFGVCQGRLRVVQVSCQNYGVEGDPALDVWELEDYESGLWNLVHKVYLKNLTLKDITIVDGNQFARGMYRFSVIYIHPTNVDVVYLMISKYIVRLNMKSMVMERIYKQKRPRSFQLSWGSTFHLADQWWPTPL